MAIYVSGKMKRKDFDEVYGDFSDSLISAPATKIRRLDVELPLIAENQEPIFPSILGKERPDEEMSSAVMDVRSGLIEAVSPSTLNEERALVMYHPPDAHMASYFKINPKLISCLKNYTFWPRNPNMLVEEEVEEEMQSPAKKCLAVVPWVPPHADVTRQVMEAFASGNEPNEEPMEAEDAEATTNMEIEDENGVSDISGIGVQANQHWKQHCMTPQLPQSNSTVMWS
ncbi:uncharacterized protein LOC110032855 [Phalaenopsis equestris]|uniref:uncharacterized protein LOC110032855 n=1 Tax=Phalaenopsis equestris TaxID=78828 RepID=UPI0009E24589|nr:uncharacterized protein LOC110032855 [Phalaenopsis equestris]